MTSATSVPELGEYPPSKDPDRSKRCVVCRKPEPDKGKLLHCLHVLCSCCASDEVAAANSIKCARCSRVTASRVTGVPLLDQLSDSQHLLYRGRSVADGGCSGGVTEGAKSSSAESAAVATATTKPPGCTICDAVDMEKEASHQCQDCNGLPLCGEHAQSHPTRRNTRGHRVSPLSSQPPQSKRMRQTGTCAVSRCMQHAAHDLITFCSTCQVPLCQQCLSTTGHAGHSVMPLHLAVEAEHQKIKKNLDDLECLSTVGERFGTSLTSAGIQSVNSEVEHAKEAGRVLSETVADIFDRIDRENKSKREQILAGIDTFVWKGLDRLYTRCERLELLRERQSTVSEIARWSEPSLPRGSIFWLSDIVNNELKNLAGELKKVRSSAQLGKEEEAVSSVLKPINDILQTSTLCHERPLSLPLDVSACRIQAQGSVTVGKEVIFSVQGISCGDVDVLASAVPEILLLSAMSGVIEEPSAQHVPVSIELSAQAGKVVGTMKFQPMHVGKHKLTIGRISKSKSFEFLSSQSPPQFDPEGCPQKIKLSLGWQVAKYQGGGYGVGSSCTVAIVRPLSTEPVRKWSIKVHPMHSSSLCLFAGVTKRPQGRSQAESFFYDDTCYFWRSNGVAGHQCGLLPASRMSAWKDGDFLTFTLDVANGTLECCCKGSGEKRIMKGIRDSHRLVPAVCLRGPGQCVELC